MESNMSSKEITIVTNTNSLPIVFISDLHFDYTSGNYVPSDAEKRKSDFLDFIDEHYKNCILCLAGDFFDDYRETLTFVKDLEKNKIIGFFVLGNHDFWNDGTKSHVEIIKLFELETKTHNYFRFLICGKKYYVNDICVIGDTGWTSFRRKNHGVLLKNFTGLPDAKRVKNFNLKSIRSMHNDWIGFANHTLNLEDKVLILTHFCMTDLTEDASGCWWSSQTNLSRNDNYWNIFGHTHGGRFGSREDNHISKQRGYHNYSDEILKMYENIGIKDMQYSPASFGVLEKISECRSLAVSNTEALVTFYSPLVVKDSNTDISLISSIQKRGFKRCAANKVNFSVLATSPGYYIKQVQSVINGYLRDTFIGYTYLGRLGKRTVDSVFSSLAILQKGDLSNIREFITAAVVTGYVYNRMPELIENMRPIDDYDIIRFYLMFATMKKYQINMDSFDSVRKHRQKHITYCNVDIYLPMVNDLSLSIEEAVILLHQTPFMSGLAEKNLIRTKRISIDVSREASAKALPINEGNEIEHEVLIVLRKEVGMTDEQIKEKINRKGFDIKTVGAICRQLAHKGVVNRAKEEGKPIENFLA